MRTILLIAIVASTEVNVFATEILLCKKSSKLDPKMFPGLTHDPSKGISDYRVESVVVGGSQQWVLGLITQADLEKDAKLPGKGFPFPSEGELQWQPQRHWRCVALILIPLEKAPPRVLRFADGIRVNVLQLRAVGKNIFRISLYFSRVPAIAEKLGYCPRESVDRFKSYATIDWNTKTDSVTTTRDLLVRTTIDSALANSNLRLEDNGEIEDADGETLFRYRIQDVSTGKSYAYKSRLDSLEDVFGVPDREFTSFLPGPDAGSVLRYTGDVGGCTQVDCLDPNHPRGIRWSARKPVFPVYGLRRPKKVQTVFWEAEKGTVVERICVDKTLKAVDKIVLEEFEFSFMLRTSPDGEWLLLQQHEFGGCRIALISMEAPSKKYQWYDRNGVFGIDDEFLVLNCGRVFVNDHKTIWQLNPFENWSRSVVFTLNPNKKMRRHAK